LRIYLFAISSANSHHSVAVLVEYLDIWDLVQEVLQPQVDDVHKWKFEASGGFSTKSAYQAFFLGAIFLSQAN
jgi:hypothetical protein